MRMVYYKAKRADGSTFHTYSYSEATNDGNHIVETCLEDMDDRTDAEKKTAQEHARKRTLKRRELPGRI